MLTKAYGLVYFVVEQAHYERILATVYTHRDETKFAAAWAAGQAMTLDAAVVYALGMT